MIKRRVGKDDIECLRGGFKNSENIGIDCLDLRYIKDLDVLPYRFAVNGVFFYSNNHGSSAGGKLKTDDPGTGKKVENFAFGQVDP